MSVWQVAHASVPRNVAPAISGGATNVRLVVVQEFVEVASNAAAAAATAALAETATARPHGRFASRPETRLEVMQQLPRKRAKNFPPVTAVASALLANRNGDNGFLEREKNGKGGLVDLRRAAARLRLWSRSPPTP